MQPLFSRVQVTRAGDEFYIRAMTSPVDIPRLSFKQGASCCEINYRRAPCWALDIIAMRFTHQLRAIMPNVIGCHGYRLMGSAVGRPSSNASIWNVGY